MGTLFQDLRYGCRMLVKNPGFTGIGVLTLALGIGANSTIFSWINSTLLNPIPGVTRTADLISVMRGERSEHPSPPFSYLDYRDLRDNNRSLSGLLAYHDDFMALTGTGKPERIYGALTSVNYFDVLGVRPILGRGFLAAEEQKPGGAPVVVISYGLWQSHFTADPSVIGRTIQINRHTYTIVGITPPGFQGCKTGLRSDVWIPLVMDRFIWGSNRPDDRGTYWLNVLGRVRPGVDRRQAEGELNLLMQQIAEHSPDSHQGPNQITLDPLWRSPFGANVYLYTTLPMLLGLAALLLLLASANVANLLLVRSVARRREIAIRLSMGANRWRLVRQLLVESLLLALAGGGAAMLLTSWTAKTFATFIPPTSLPLTLNGRADRTVILVTLVISALTGMIFGILPALRTSRLAPVAVLKEEAGSVSGGLHKSRLASGLVVAQISLSLLLLICAGLFTRSLQNAQRSDPGFDPNRVLLASYELGPAGYSEAAGIGFDRKLLAKLEALPGVESVTLADFSPLSFTLHADSVEPEGYVPRLHESMEIDRANAGPNYFRTMRTPLIAGRDFTPQDSEKSQPVAIVNQVLVDRYWPGQDAIGKRIRTFGQWFTVVGVARNGKYRRLIYSPEPVIFLPLFQDYRDPVIIHARVSGDPRAFAFAVERTVHEIDPDLPLFNVTTLKASMQFGSMFERIAATFVSSFGLLAMVLAAVGIYGVVAYATRQRTREIGIRMALGARQPQVLRLVLAQGFRLTLMGLAIGLGLSFALTPFLRSQLFGVTATDALTYVSVLVLLCLVALVACYIPAWRATKVDPTVALRCE
jgi:predicted permease